ncbi:MAG: zf-HC2 domain-containing protein, partial [Gammaproteobacteria bacterium]|nr:zf-HC2 domain-containing protein [Gammaproteobacteria bacterium]
MSSQYSEELINAFVDGELDGNEKEEFRNAMSENQELSQRVNLLCELKQSVQLSYSAIPEPAKVNQLNGALGYKNLWQLSYAAVLFLVVGVFFG